MTVKNLKDYLSKLPDDMPIGLLDLSTDDFEDCNYSINENNLSIDDYVSFEDQEIIGKALYITFENKLNENPIN